MEKKILEILTSHGILVTPETLQYLLKKTDPEKFVKYIFSKFSEVPLFLTMEIVKSVEVSASELNELPVGVVKHISEVLVKEESGKSNRNIDPSPIATKNNEISST